MSNKFRLFKLLPIILANFVLLETSFAQNCVQKPSFAMSPYKLKCEEFDSSCDIPKDWIRLNSCDLADITKGMHNVDASNVRDATLKLRDANNSGANFIPGYLNPKDYEKRTIPGGMGFYEQSNVDNERYLLLLLRFS